jgi:pimeloyl-ACP methyl ester carboxylesterase
LGQGRILEFVTPDKGSVEQVNTGSGHLVQLATHRLVDLVEGMHHAVVRPWFSLVGPAGDRLHRTHRAGASGIYGLVRLGGSAVAGVVDRRGVADRAGVDSATAVANALWGDDPQRPTRSDITIRDTSGGVLLPTAGGLVAGFPDAKRRLIVLIHGLGQTERSWDGTVGMLGDGCSLVRVRYNTGLPISSSAADLASLLDLVVSQWPAEVDEVILVGYSMGGLVARAAVNRGHANNHRWVAHIRRVITIAAPLLGSPIEKGAEALARGLEVAPQTRPLADFVSSRSQGIKDLRHGSPEDDVLPDHVEHHCIAAVVTEDHSHIVGRLLGDLVVRATSATGRGRHRSIEQSSVHVFGGRHHANVLDAPELPALLSSLAIGGITC